MNPNENQTSDNNGKYELDFDTYHNHRQTLIQLGLDQGNAYDKHLLATSTAALGLIFYLIRDGILQSDNQRCLIIGIACLLLTIVFTISSFILAKFACEMEIKDWDNLYETGDSSAYSYSNRYSFCVNTLNILSGVSLFCGLALISIFVLSNI